VFRVLLVEDNEANRDMLSRRLTRHGWEVLLAGDGRQGVCVATDQHPDLILMDLRMPDLDGWAASRQLKSNIAAADIPIIALTAHAMNGDRERALAAGCDEFETKPVDFDRLLQKMAALTVTKAAYAL
jgi:CheY-like chemotaxis protein